MMAAAAAKRPLDQNKLKGGGETKTYLSSKLPPASKAPPSPSSTIASPTASSSAAATSGSGAGTGGGGGGGGGMTGAIVVGTAALAGGAAYLYYNEDAAPDWLPLPWKLEQQQQQSTDKGEEAKPAADKPAEEAAGKEKETPPTTSGNRVTQIDMPPAMMNKSSAPPVEPKAHPVMGNRVTMPAAGAAAPDAPPKDRAGDVTDTSDTQSAMQQLQTSATMEAAKSLIQSHQALWTSLEETHFANLDKLTPAQLKARIVQLATEMKDRTQWEAVRLKEFLALKEKETSQQYTELLQKQRLEFEEILATRLRDQDAAFHNQLKETLEEKDASVQSVIKAALDAQQLEHDQDKEAFATKCKNETQIELNKQYGEQMMAYKQATEEDLQKKVNTLVTLSNKLRQLEAALEASQKSQQGSSQAHKLSAAALALSEILETHSPAAKEVQALQTAAGHDGVIATAVRTLPSTVQSEGVPTLPELQTQFEQQYSTCRQAALVPPGRPGLDGQLAGMVFATLKYPPLPEDPAPEDDPNSAEYVLARARKFVQLGELSSAIDELEKLQGQVAFVVQDWKKMAMDRVAVEKAVKVIKLECALLHESVAN